MMRLPSLLLLLPVAAACGGGGSAAIDGGPIGTGISTSIVGNVVAVSAPAAADAPPPPITVSVDEVPGLATTTDAAGAFALEGDLAGALTLRFDAGDLSVTQALDVPSGSVLVLSDVELSPDGVEALAGHQLGFVGRATEVDCAAGRLTVADPRDPGNAYAVTLLPETRIVRRDATRGACADLAAGERVGVDGVVRLGSRRAIVALRLTVAAEPEPPAPAREVPLLGRVIAVGCARGVLALAGRDQRTRLRLTDATTLRRADGTPLACADVRLGDLASGVGRVTLRDPGVVAAVDLTLEPAGPPAEVRVAGFLVEVDCRRGMLLLAEGDTEVALRLLPGTVVEPPLRCEDLTLGDRVGGLARVGDDPVLLDALRLRVRRSTRRGS